MVLKALFSRFKRLSVIVIPYIEITTVVPACAFFIPASCNDELHRNATFLFFTVVAEEIHIIKPRLKRGYDMVSVPVGVFNGIHNRNLLYSIIKFILFGAGYAPKYNDENGKSQIRHFIYKSY